MVVTLIGNRRFDSSLKMGHIIGNEVRQIGVLCMIPALLHRIQLGGIGWKWLEGKPIRMVLFEECRRRFVHVPSIPNDDDVTAVVLVQESKQPDQLVGVNILWHDVEVEG